MAADEKGREGTNSMSESCQGEADTGGANTGGTFVVQSRAVHAGAGGGATAGGGASAAEIVQAEGLEERRLLVEFLPVRQDLPECKGTNGKRYRGNPARCPTYHGRRKLVVSAEGIDLVAIHEVLLPEVAIPQGVVWNASFTSDAPKVMHFQGLQVQTDGQMCDLVSDIDRASMDNSTLLVDFTFSQYISQLSL
eukprot:TRINITY_DN31388_c0_g1_i1.p1 TRINITY_DN31388_c0_g1~~TRINITY_DN31388_c0_g1_i1.p1  ORF type:complete len:219 (+),score=5.06 TRINITY_DN31388_c0_g1_i1:76-657(+)